MRIFLEGTEEWMESCGKVFIVLASMMLLIASLAFVWRMHDLFTWHKAEGVVTEAKVVAKHSDNGTKMCSVEYRIRYTVSGVTHEIKPEPSLWTNECDTWEREAVALRGKGSVVLYDPFNPPNGYADGGKNSDFFLVSIMLGTMALLFGLLGILMIFIGRNMQRRGLKMP